MAKNLNKVLEEMRLVFDEQIDEIVGRDIPKEGEEDFERISLMRSYIASIATIEEAIDYVEELGWDVPQFLEQWDLSNRENLA